mmetsp:Transcript_78507/g.243502  ORF Transcript_78507/g.243502 Transcript_78507/m.243502 type:complete len:346 (-) Transcript_78507:2367-3404(-)
MRAPARVAATSSALGLLVEDAAPADALVQDRRLRDHLEGEHGGEEAADDGEHGRGAHLRADELAREERPLVARLREWVVALDEERDQKSLHGLEGASAKGAVPQHVDLRAARHDEGLDAREQAEDDRDDEEHQDDDLGEYDDGPKAEVRVHAAPQAAVATPTANAAAVAKARWVLVPLLALHILRRVRASAEAGGPHAVEKDARRQGGKDDVVGDPQGLVELGHQIENGGAFDLEGAEDRGQSAGDCRDLLPRVLQVLDHAGQRGAQHGHGVLQDRPMGAQAELGNHRGAGGGCKVCAVVRVGSLDLAAPFELVDRLPLHQAQVEHLRNLLGGDVDGEGLERVLD